MVNWKDGTLTVDGQPCPLGPLNPGARIPSLNFHIPAGHYLILPSVGPRLPENLSPGALHTLTVIPAEAIRGRVLLRSYPPGRLQRIS